MCARCADAKVESRRSLSSVPRLRLWSFGLVSVCERHLPDRAVGMEVVGKGEGKGMDCWDGLCR